MSEDGVGWDDPDPWNSFFMSTFAIGFDEGIEGVVDDAEDEIPLGGRVGLGVGAVVDVDFPFTLLSAVTVPKDLTPSNFRADAEADEEDMGSPALSIDPKVTAEPFFRRVSNSRMKGHAVMLTCFYGPHCIPRYTNAIFYGDTLAKSTRSP